MRERPAAPRESASPPFGKLVFGSFPMFPSPGFPGRKARHLGRGFELVAPAREHRYSRIAVRKRNGIGACLANGPAHFFIFPPNYTPFAPEAESARG